MSFYFSDDDDDSCTSQSETSSMDREDIKCYISALLDKEKHYMCHDYLQGFRRVEGAVDAKCRSRVCQWIFDTVDCARLDRHTAIVAISYLDRYLSSTGKGPKLDRIEFQLAAIATVYLAVKVTAPIEIYASSLAKLSRGIQSANNIIAYERKILHSLKWQLTDPTPCQFITYLISLLPDSTSSSVVSQITCESQRLIELACKDYAFVPLRRSTVAITAVLKSLGVLSLDEFSMDRRDRFLQDISSAFDVDAKSPLIQAVQLRLPAISSRSVRFACGTQTTSCCRKDAPNCIPIQEGAI